MATEKDFLAAGADCVCGDLILNRVTVGRYRNGQFYPTDEGAMMQLSAPEAAPAPAPAPAQATGGKKKKAAAEPAPAPETVEGAAGADLLADLDSLGA